MLYIYKKSLWHVLNLQKETKTVSDIKIMKRLIHKNKGRSLGMKITKRFSI